MQVIARINIDSPTGLKLVREIEKHTKIAKVEYPHPTAYGDFTNNTTTEEAFDNLMDKLNDHYGTNFKLR